MKFEKFHLVGDTTDVHFPYGAMLHKGSFNHILIAHSKDIEELKADIQDVKLDMAAVKSLLVMKYKNVSPVFSQKRSPRQLNEIGLRLFADIDGKTFLEKNREFLFQKINGCNPHTALDVENAAYFACTAYTDNEIFNELKNFVYNAPAYLIKDEVAGVVFVFRQRNIGISA